MVSIGRIDEVEEGLMFSSDNIKMRLGSSASLAGSLFINERALMFRPNQSEDGISIPWAKIGLHAVSSNPNKCIYFMVDSAITWPGVYENNADRNGDAIEEQDEDEGHETDGSENEMTEFWLEPEPRNDPQVDQIFNAMKQCQSLNPDPQADSISEEEEDEDDFMEAEDEPNMQNLHLDDDDKFADAEEN